MLRVQCFLALFTVTVAHESLDDKFWDLGVAEQLGRAEDAKLPVTKGKLPAWLQGTYVLGGPSQFRVGKRHVNHLFDGFARISSFKFEQEQEVIFFVSYDGIQMVL